MNGQEYERLSEEITSEVDRERRSLEAEGVEVEIMDAEGQRLAF